MVVNSVPSPTSSPSEAEVFDASIDRQFSYYRPHPFVFTMYSPSYNPYYGPSHPGGGPVSAPGPPYPVYSAADSSPGHSTKYGPPPPSSSGYGGGSSSGHGGSSYGPPGPPSGGYEYHHHSPPPHPPVSHPIPVHISKWKPKKGKGAALSALTLLAFLYFLNLLQSCLKEHMDTMNPTVMVMTAGATRRKDVEDVLTGEKDEMIGAYDVSDHGYGTVDGKYHLLTTSGNQTDGFDGGKKHVSRIRKIIGPGPKHRDTQSEVIYYEYY
ncbi:uncharacterized protein LOC134205844 [Armigeres subalbatus]|uniref:uncharacterized protein LOC134205844 n=1 Tax=Armigeres subalbatus TaxID=124917 RepID=UPI002ED2A5A2